MAELPSENYRALSVDTIVEYLHEVDNVMSLLGENTKDWFVSEIGDGNLNLVFLIQSTKGSIIAKQALPYLRMLGDGWPLPLSRAFFEHEALIRQYKRTKGMTPQVIHFDRGMALIVMEHLSPHIILRKGLVSGRQYPNIAKHLGQFLARTLFRGSDLSMDAAAKKADVALFTGNHALSAVTENRVFTEPYFDAELNRWTRPYLDNSVAVVRTDSELKAGVHELKTQYMSKAQTLVHGDLHSGSVMVTESDSRVIDPEFAFYGPMGFDVGALLGNYLLAYLAQPGHADLENDRLAYSEWILTTLIDTWSNFEDEFQQLWRTERTGCLFPTTMFSPDDEQHVERALSRYLNEVMTDSFGFAGVKMIRRMVGAAHVEDMESIADPKRRANCEKNVLALGRAMIVERNKLSSYREVATMARRIRKSEPTN